MLKSIKSKKMLFNILQWRGFMLFHDYVYLRLLVREQ